VKEAKYVKWGPT